MDNDLFQLSFVFMNIARHFRLELRLTEVLLVKNSQSIFCSTGFSVRTDIEAYRHTYFFMSQISRSKIVSQWSGARKSTCVSKNRLKLHPYLYSARRSEHAPQLLEFVLEFLIMFHVFY